MTYKMGPRDLLLIDVYWILGTEDLKVVQFATLVEPAAQNRAESAHAHGNAGGARCPEQNRSSAGGGTERIGNASQG